MLRARVDLTTHEITILEQMTEEEHTAFINRAATIFSPMIFKDANKGLQSRSQSNIEK